MLPLQLLSQPQPQLLSQTPPSPPHATHTLWPALRPCLPADAADVIERKTDHKGKQRYYVHYLECEQQQWVGPRPRTVSLS